MENIKYQTKSLFDSYNTEYNEKNISSKESSEKISKNNTEKNILSISDFSLANQKKKDLLQYIIKHEKSF